MRGARRPSAATVSGGPEGLSATPTDESGPDERSEEGNAGRRQSPLCPSSLPRRSGASATDRGHDCCCDRGKRMDQPHLDHHQLRRIKPGGGDQVASVCRGKSGFGLIHGSGRRDAGINPSSAATPGAEEPADQHLINPDADAGTRLPWPPEQRRSEHRGDLSRSAITSSSRGRNDVVAGPGAAASAAPLGSPFAPSGTTVVHGNDGLRDCSGSDRSSLTPISAPDRDPSGAFSTGLLCPVPGHG